MAKTKQETKERVLAWLYPSMVKKMESLIELHNFKNKTEFIERATDFYSGYLATQDGIGYLPQVLVDAIEASIKKTENRHSNNIFRLSVEMAMMMHIIACGLEISDEQLKALRGRCIQQVKKNRGKITMEDAVRFQQGIEDEINI